MGLAYGIDAISGAVSLAIKNPYLFLSSPLMSKYPLTSLGIFARSIGLFLVVWLLASLIDGMNFKKVIAMAIVTVLSNLFAIQQLATGVKVTTVQWTISIAYASTLLVIPMVYYLIKGMTGAVTGRVGSEKKVEVVGDEFDADEEEDDE